MDKFSGFSTCFLSVLSYLIEPIPLSLPLSPSSSGLGRRPFTALTRVQIPLGTQGELESNFQLSLKAGPVAQLVSAPPCHGGGRGFKSRLGRDLFLIFLCFYLYFFSEAKPSRVENKFDWLGSSVGTSERLKIVRSPVRSRPKPLTLRIIS